MKSFFSFLLKIGISIGLLIFLFQRIDIKTTLLHMRAVEPVTFSIGVFLFVVVNFLGLYRWFLLLRSINSQLTLWRVFVSFGGGMFFNLFLPTSIGGDVAKTVDLALHTKDASSVAATVIVDRLSGAFGLILVALFGFVVGRMLGLTSDTRMLVAIFIIAALFSSLTLILFSSRIFAFTMKLVPFAVLKTYMKKFHHACYRFRTKKGLLLRTLWLSLIIQGGFSIVQYFIGASLGIKINPIFYFILIPIVSAISMLPLSIGGLGLRDNAAVVLFARVGVSADQVVALTLIQFALLVLFGVIGGIIYSTSLERKKQFSPTKAHSS